MIEPIVSKIEVPCSQEKAFSVFANDMGKWWPLDKRAMSLYDGQSVKELRIEPKLGGRIVEISDNDTEYHWGTITSFDPFGAIDMDFHMGLPADNASLVEVRFVALDGQRTEVTLTHSTCEAFGDMAEMMRGGYGSGWVLIFEEGYKSACED